MTAKQGAFKKRSAGSFIGFFILSGILGLVFGLIGGYIGASVVKGINGIASGLIGLLIGYPVGVIVGIAIMKATRHYGSLGFAALGSILGAVLVIMLEMPLNLHLDPILLFGAFFILIPLLGLIGFSLKKQIQPVQAKQEVN